MSGIQLIKVILSCRDSDIGLINECGVVSRDSVIVVGPEQDYFGGLIIQGLTG